MARCRRQDVRRRWRRQGGTVATGASRLFVADLPDRPCDDANGESVKVGIVVRAVAAVGGQRRVRKGAAQEGAEVAARLPGAAPAVGLVEGEGEAAAALRDVAAVVLVRFVYRVFTVRPVRVQDSTRNTVLYHSAHLTRGTSANEIQIQKDQIFLA